MATTTKTRTITLTERRPVRITDAAWPLVASATGDSYGSGDDARHEQALARGEIDRYAIRVRQHADGRAIVYAVLDAASAWTGSEDRRGGERLDAGADLASAIRRVGEDCRIPDSVIRECTADLPAEDLSSETGARDAHTLAEHVRQALAALADRSGGTDEERAVGLRMALAELDALEQSRA